MPLLWIRIHIGLPLWIRLLIETSVADLDPDPLVRDTDPVRILLSSSKNSKKNIDSYCFVTSSGPPPPPNITHTSDHCKDQELTV